MKSPLLPEGLAARIDLSENAFNSLKEANTEGYNIITSEKGPSGKTILDQPAHVAYSICASYSPDLGNAIQIASALGRNKDASEEDVRAGLINCLSLPTQSVILGSIVSGFIDQMFSATQVSACRAPKPEDKSKPRIIKEPDTPEAQAPIQLLFLARTLRTIIETLYRRNGTYLKANSPSTKKAVLEDLASGDPSRVKRAQDFQDDPRTKTPSLRMDVATQILPDLLRMFATELELHHQKILSGDIKLSDGSDTPSFTMKTGFDGRYYHGLAGIIESNPDLFPPSPELNSLLKTLRNRSSISTAVGNLHAQYINNPPQTPEEIKEALEAIDEAQRLAQEQEEQEENEKEDPENDGLQSLIGD